MVILNIFLLLLLNNLIFCIKNKINKYKDNKINLRILNVNPIQNIPVDNNIPIIVQDINENENISNHINNIPIPIRIPIIIPDINNQIKIITNTSIKINNTKKDPMCTPECCAGCEVQFQKLALQKNCITNICKCQIIEINKEKINETIKNIKEDKLISLMKYEDGFNNREENNFSYSYYLFIIIIFVIYEIYVIYKMNDKGNLFINKNSLKKDKEKRIKDYMDLLYGDEELIECLI